jgi:hypothetical protein
LANFLQSISATGPDDVWAVGQTAHLAAANGRWESFTIHWNGSRWSAVPAPSPGKSDNDLEDVMASADGIWAAGQYSDHGVSGRKPFALQWNGSLWTKVPAPTVSGQMLAVASSPSDGVFTVGYFERPFQGLAERLGSGGFVDVPVGGGQGTDLIDVAFQGDGTGWSVGADSTATYRSAPLIERWTCA